VYGKLPHLLSVLALCAGLGAISGCGPSKPARDTFVDKDYPVPALRFAGVDLLYAVRRLAAEAGVVTVVDELRRTGQRGEDLRTQRLDIDLPAGDLRSALEALYEAAPHFDYHVADGTMLVRSRRVLAEHTALDIRDLPASKVTVDFRGLVTHIMSERPRTYLRIGNIVGMPVRLKVDLDIAEGSSVLDVFVQFATRTKTGMLIRRAGYRVTEEEKEAGPILIAATTVEMIPALTNAAPVTRLKNERGIVAGLADMERRGGKPILVRDRSLLSDSRGALNFTHGKDSPKRPVADVLNSIGSGKGGRRDKFSWTEDEQFIRIDSTAFQDFPTGRVLLGEELQATKFQGTLSELVRFVNDSRKNPSSKLVMGGEILDSAPEATIDIPDGMTVEEALDAHSLSTGEGWVYVVHDRRYPHQTVDPGGWSGAYVSRLQDWDAKPRVKR